MGSQMCDGVGRKKPSIDSGAKGSGKSRRVECIPESRTVIRKVRGHGAVAPIRYHGPEDLSVMQKQRVPWSRHSLQPIMDIIHSSIFPLSSQPSPHHPLASQPPPITSQPYPLAIPSSSQPASQPADKPIILILGQNLGTHSLGTRFLFAWVPQVCWQLGWESLGSFNHNSR